MSTETTCLYFKYGYCKRGEYCWKQHVEIKCESSECDGRNCEKRHPRVCRFYNDYGRCKFGESCSYNHVDRYDPVLEELKRVKAKLNMVEVQINERNLEIKLLLEKLELALGAISKGESKENYDTTMDVEQVKSPEINTDDDSGNEAISQGSQDENNEEDKSGKKLKKKKRKKNSKKNDDKKSREIVICYDSQATQYDSVVTSSMLENLEVSPIFKKSESVKNDEKGEKDESMWICLCCHTVCGFNTEDELIAHHISHNVEYGECHLCYTEVSNNGSEYDGSEYDDSFLKMVESALSSKNLVQ